MDRFEGRGVLFDKAKGMLVVPLGLEIPIFGILLGIVSFLQVSNLL